MLAANILVRTITTGQLEALGPEATDRFRDMSMLCAKLNRGKASLVTMEGNSTLNGTDASAKIAKKKAEMAQVEADLKVVTAAFMADISNGLSKAADTKLSEALETARGLEAKIADGIVIATVKANAITADDVKLMAAKVADQAPRQALSLAGKIGRVTLAAVREARK